MDEFAVSSQSGHVKKLLKFDLDLPSSDYDDITLKTGITTPEWDYKKRVLVEDHCHIELMRTQLQEAKKLPAHLRKPARQIRAFRLPQIELPDEVYRLTDPTVLEW